MMEFYNLHPDKIKIANIMAIGRASTMFLQGLLNSHPEIATIIGLFQIYKQDFENKNSASVASSIYERMKEQVEGYFSNYDLEKNFPREIFAKHLKEYTDVFGVNYKTVFIGAHYAYAKHFKKDLSKIKYILSNAHTSRNFFRLYRYFPKQRIIFCVRDPRATLLSARKRNSLIKSLLDPYDSYVLYKKLVKKNKNNVLAIKHEVLHGNYSQVKSDIANFLKIRNSDSFGSASFFNKPYYGSEGKHGSINKLKSSKPDKMFLREEWKTELSTSEIRGVQLIFSGMMEEFGYEKIKNFGRIDVVFFHSSYEGLSLKHILKAHGWKRYTLRFLRGIYFVPLIGPLIMKLLVGLKLFGDVLIDYLRIRLNKIN